VNHVMRRRKPKMMSKAVFIFMLLSVQALPASGLCDIRRKAWRDLSAGTCGERENLLLRCQGRNASGYNRKRQSTNAERRGGASRSSDEYPVMGLERRGCLIPSFCTVNRKREEQDG
jgi:hypothetical protein